MDSILRLKVPYKINPDSYGAHIYIAMLNVQLALATPNAPRTKRFEAVIDSGATRCLFHADIARHLGLDLTAGNREVTQGITGETETFVHEVSLYIPGGAVTIHAGFKEELPVAGLLGMNGFFEHFKIEFDSIAKACVLQRLHRA